MDVRNTLDPVTTSAWTSFLGYRTSRDDPKRAGYSLWQEPTSNNSGRTFLRKKDDQKGVDYLYDRIVTRTPIMQRNSLTGQQTQRTTGSIFGYGGTPMYSTQVQYKRRGLAPGQSPEGTRQPEQARRRSGAGDQSGGSNYATNRNKAGRRGTILTGPRGTLGQSSNSSGKTLLGA